MSEPLMTIRLAIAIAVALVVTLLADPSHAAATTAYRLTLEELTENADAIVRARVTAVEARWTTAPRQIWRFATLMVDEVYLDATGNVDADDEIVVRARGGTVGEITAHVPGAAPFELSEDAAARVVVFLWIDPDGHWQVVGMTQGLFNVRSGDAENADDSDTGGNDDDVQRDIVLENSYAGLCIVDRDAKPLAPREALAAAAAMRVTETELRDAIDERDQ